MIHTRLGTQVVVRGGTKYAGGDVWLDCLYEDGTTCPIHISDLLETRSGEILAELERTTKGEKQTIEKLTGFKWVVMTDTQTPKLVGRVEHRHLRDRWTLFVGDKTFEEATMLINQQWGLDDRGFIVGDCGIEWNWWEAA